MIARLIRSNVGMSIMELIMVLSILILLSFVSISAFSNYRKNVSLENDTKMIVEVLREARNQTLSSKNASQYGVHFSLSNFVLFTGDTYSSSDINNKTYSLGRDTNLIINLNGGGNDIVFKRLSGDTDQYGTISISNIKNIVINKTGIIESQ